MTWRDQYRVHPAAAVFPMIDDDELDKLSEDIKANGLRDPITFQRGEGLLLDGRNRIEAMERAGIVFDPHKHSVEYGGDPVAFIFSKNIRRRHLTKQQQADMIVAAVRATAAAVESANMAQADSYIAPNSGPPKLRQVGEVSKGGRGRVDQEKAAAVEIATEHGISQRTVERSIAKAEGKVPAPARPQGVGIAVPVTGTAPTPKPAEPSTPAPGDGMKIMLPLGITAARRHYVAEFAALPESERVKEWGKLQEAINNSIDVGG